MNGIDNLENFIFLKEHSIFQRDFLLEYLEYQVLASANNVFHFSTVREGFELRFRVLKEKSLLVNGILPIK